MPVFDWRVLILCLSLGTIACGDKAPDAEAGAAEVEPEAAAEKDAPEAAGAAEVGEAEVAAAEPTEGSVAEERDLAPPPEDPAPLPPSLAPGALRDELRRASRQMPGDRKQLLEERQSLVEERARLEAMAAEIEKARLALREETSRLESLLQDKRPAPPNRAPAQAPVGPTAPDGDRLDTLAKSVRGMRSEQAAALLTRLPRPLAAGLLLRLRPNEVGPILDKLTPEVGAELVGQVLALPSREDA